MKREEHRISLTWRPQPAPPHDHGTRLSSPTQVERPISTAKGGPAPSSQGDGRLKARSADFIRSGTAIGENTLAICVICGPIDETDVMSGGSPIKINIGGAGGKPSPAPSPSPGD